MFAVLLLAITFPPRPAAAESIPTHVRYIYGCKGPGDLREPMGIAYDERNHEIYVADTGNSRVCLYTADGMPEYEFKSYRDGKQIVQFVAPISVAVNSAGDIFVSDSFLGRVVAMDFQGTMKYSLDLSAAGPGQVSPERIAVDAVDNLFVADATNNQILVFDTGGHFKFRFGRRKGEPSIEQVSGIYPDSAQSRIYVTSKSGTAVWIFDYGGNLLGCFGIHDSGPMNFSFPAGIVALSDGTIIVADTLRSEVKAFDAADKYAYRFGGMGDGPDATNYPVDLALDHDGNIYVLEKITGAVHVFALPGAKASGP